MVLPQQTINAGQGAPGAAPAPGQPPANPRPAAADPAAPVAPVAPVAPAATAQSGVTPPPAQTNTTATSQAPQSPPGTTASQTPSQTATVLVPPRDPSIIQEIKGELSSLMQIGLLVVALWKPCAKVLQGLASLYWASVLHVENLKVPDKGCYGCTGHGPTDARVTTLIEDQKRHGQNIPIRISGSQDVGMFLIAKSLAAHLDRPLLKICCRQLSNTEGQLSGLFVTAIALRALWCTLRYGKKEVVLVLDGLEDLASTNQKPFIEQLNKALGTPTSWLRWKALIVGITYQEGEQKCSSETQVSLLNGLKYSFENKVHVEPPKTATERFNLLRHRISSIIAYQGQWKDYQMPHEDQSFLMSVARAMPEIAKDRHLRAITDAVIKASQENNDTPIRGEQFNRVVLDTALYAIKDKISPPISSPETLRRDARAVICEAFVAHVLGRTLMALGVQARSNKSYVCRERLDEGENTIGDLVKEAIALQARRLSYSLADTRKVALDAPTNEIGTLDEKISTIITDASERVVQAHRGEHTPELEKIKKLLSGIVFTTARELLAQLSHAKNKEAFDTLLATLAPTTPGATPVELKNGELTKALANFDLEEAYQITATNLETT